MAINQSLKDNPNFKFLLIGQFISVLGERISTLVFFSIAVAIIGSNSSFFASLLIAIQYIPLFVFGYYFGYLADKHSKKNLMLLADILRAVFVLILILNTNSLLLLYLCVFSIGFLTAVFEPSKKALIPFIVKKKDIVKLNRVFAVSEILAIFFGLLIGSIILEILTVKQALILNAITYVISFFMVLLIKYKDKIKKKIKSHFIQDLKEGLKYLKSNYNSRHVILNVTMINFFAAGLNYAAISDYTIRNSLGYDAGTQIGVALLTITAGALLSPFVNRYVKKYKDSNLISAIFLFGGILVMFMSLLLYFNIANLIELLLFFFFSGIFIGLIYTRILYLLHQNTKKQYLGRVISINDITSSLTVTLGVIIGGSICEYFTYTAGFFLTGLVFFSGYLYFRKTYKKLKW